MANYRVNLKYNPVRDADIIAQLEKQDNKQDYIRRLILSDIAASALLGLQSDIEDGSYKERIKFWEEHCRACADPGEDDPCECCPYIDYPYLGTDDRRCTLESKWEVYKHGKV